MAHDRDVLNDGFIDDTFDDINPRETEGFKFISYKKVETTFGCST